MKLDNFRVEELVSPAVFELLGEHAINLLDKEFIRDVDRLVTDLKADLNVKSATVNNWLWKGHRVASGFREQGTSVGAPRSAHRRGLAVDMQFKGASVADCYTYLLNNQSKYPKIRRIESLVFTPTWLHVDGVDTGRPEIHVFNP